MHRLTQTQLRRYLDGAIEIIQPVADGLYAVEILMALLMLKRASDQAGVSDVRDTKQNQGGGKDAQGKTEAKSTNRIN